MKRATSEPIFVFLGLSVLDLGPMYATDRRQTDIRRASLLNAPYPRCGGIIMKHVTKTATTAHTHTQTHTPF